MDKDEFGDARLLFYTIALISFVKGYFDASALSPIWSGLAAAAISPFMIVLPSGVIAILVSKIFGGKGFRFLFWACAVFLVLFLDLTMKGGGCDGYEVEDRWGVTRCYER